MTLSINDSSFLRSLKKKPVANTPVWIMRQAGRYLPEYRKVREQAGDFLTLCKTPELACEVTLQPLRRFALDAAILFSDILTIPDAMGLGLHFIEGEGPRFNKPITSVQQIEQLSTDIQDNLGYVFDAAALIRSQMSAHLPLIGFSGSPWTLACYMVEGGSSKDYKKVLRLMYSEPDAMHQLLQKLALSIVAYLKGQIEAGVNAVMIFDTWGGILNTANFQDFSLRYLQFITQKIKQAYPDIPVTLFTKGGGQWLEGMANTGCDALGLDWTCDLAKARAQVGHKVALQGNLDPTVLLTDEATIRNEVKKVLASYGTGSGHIFNLGHGITPDVPPEHLSVLIDAVKEFSPQYHLEDVVA